MPEEITGEDGVKRTVYSQDEVTDLQKGADKNKERKEAFVDLDKNLDLKEGQTREERLAEIKESANPNWAKYRTKHKAMEKELKDSGKQFDDNGQLVDGDKPFSQEETDKKINEAVANAITATTNTQKTDSLLSNFSEEDKKVIKPHLDKLMIVYPNDLQGNLNMAVQKAYPTDMPDAVKQTLSSAGGRGPKINLDGKKDGFTSSDEGKAMLSKILPQNIKDQIAKDNK